MDGIRRSLYAQAGQTTAEYALVILVAGVIVGLFAAFVRSGALDELFQSVIGGLTDRVNG